MAHQYCARTFRTIPTIFSALLIVFSVAGCGTSTPDPQAATTTSAASIIYNVRVQSSANNNNISNAKVTVEVSGEAPVEGYADTNGFARLSINGRHAGKAARVIIEAHDYQNYSQNITIQAESLPDIIKLNLTDPPNPIDPTPASSALTATTSMETATTVPTAAPTPPRGGSLVDLVACSNSTNFDSSQEHTAIAVAVPFTGASEDKGKAMAKSAKLAFSTYCSLMQKYEPQVELAIYDDEGSSEQNSVQEVADEIKNSDALCFVGHRLSTTSLIAKQTYQDADLAMISPSSSVSNLTDPYNKTWRLTGTDRDQGSVGAAFVKNQTTAQKPFVIYDASRQNAREAAAAFVSGFASNIPSTKNRFDSTTMSDESKMAFFEKELEDVKASGYMLDIIFFAGDVVDANILFVAMNKIGVRQLPVIATDSSDSPSLNSQGIKAYVTTMAMPMDVKSDNGQIFSAIYAESPDSIPAYTAETYDATYMCIRGITQALEEKKTLPSRTEVLNTLRSMLQPSNKISWPEIFTGPYTFFGKDDTKPGDVKVPGFYIRELDNQKLTTTYRWNKTNQQWSRIEQ